MKNDQRRKKLLFASIAAVALGLILVVLPFFLPVWLVRDRLSDTLHQHIAIQKSSVSWSGPTRLEGVELCADRASLPWLKANAITADFGLWHALSRSAEPVALSVVGAELNLELDAAGNVMTRYPESGSGARLPTIRFSDSVLRIRQEGHPTLEIKEIAGELIPKGEGFALEIQSLDEGWGHPKGHGGILLKPGFELDLHVESTRPVKVDPEQLKSIPFVGIDVWDTVKLNGSTPVIFDLGLHPEQVTYKVEVNPSQTTVEIPMIGFRAIEAKGTVKIDAGRVVFQNISGKAYDGNISLPEGEFSFTPEAKKIKLGLDVKNFSMKAMPEFWGDRKLFQLLPVNARMSGVANILISWGEKQAFYLGGGGEGKVQATILGISRSEWALQLRSIGNRFIVIPELSRLPAPFGILRRK